MTTKWGGEQSCGDDVSPYLPPRYVLGSHPHGIPNLFWGHIHNVLKCVPKDLGSHIPNTWPDVSPSSPGIPQGFGAHIPTSPRAPLEVFGSHTPTTYPQHPQVHPQCVSKDLGSHIPTFPPCSPKDLGLPSPPRVPRRVPNVSEHIPQGFGARIPRCSPRGIGVSHPHHASPAPPICAPAVLHDVLSSPHAVPHLLHDPSTHSPRFAGDLHVGSLQGQLGFGVGFGAVGGFQGHPASQSDVVQHAASQEDLADLLGGVLKAAPRRVQAAEAAFEEAQSLAEGRQGLVVQRVVTLLRGAAGEEDGGHQPRLQRVAAVAWGGNKSQVGVPRRP